MTFIDRRPVGSVQKKLPWRDGKKYLVPLSESPIYFTGGELRSDAPASHLQ